MRDETIKALIERNATFGGIAQLKDVVRGATRLGVSESSANKTIAELAIVGKLQVYQSHNVTKVRSLI